MRDQTIQKTFILKILEIMFLMMVAQGGEKGSINPNRIIEGDSIKQ